MTSRPRADVVITGIGTACAVGTGCDALWAALSSGRDGLLPIERFDVTGFVTRIAGLWPEWARADPKTCTAAGLAIVSAREAWASARAADAGLAPERIALILGTCFGERYDGFSELTQAVAQALGAHGPRITVSTACSSSTTAVGLGRDLIAEGSADLVIAGGVDVLTQEVFAGFHAIGALSTGKCAPFGAPAGMSLGEGSGFVILEPLERAQARRVEPVAHVRGYGLSSDAHHETAPDPSGSGVARAIHAALDDAGLTADAIDFVSAHGTGTDSNDAAEWLAVRSALSDQIAVSSTKSFLGHAQGAAGVLELAALLLCLRRGVVPPTLRCEPPRAGAPKDPVKGGVPRAHPVRNAVKLSAAFGGANAALIVGRAPATAARRPRRAVRVAGVSAIGPHGFDVAALEAAITTGAALVGAVAPFELSQLLRSAPGRDLDPSATYACAAAALALGDAKLTVRGPARERAGIFTGSTRMPARSVHECQSSIDKRGIVSIAAAPFTRMVINAPAGTCAKLLSLKGPLLALSAGSSSGLLAIIRAAEHLASRATADLLVAGGLDELAVPRSPGDVERLRASAEGAAFAILQAGDDAKGPLLAGWGVAGPNDLRAAIARALEGSPEIDGVVAALPRPLDALSGGPADPSRLPLGLTDVHALASGAEATASAWAFVLAATRVRRGLARRLLVVSAGGSVSCAAVIAGAPDGH